MIGRFRLRTKENYLREFFVCQPFFVGVWIKVNHAAIGGTGGRASTRRAFEFPWFRMAKVSLHRVIGILVNFAFIIVQCVCLHWEF